MINYKTQIDLVLDHFLRLQRIDKSDFAETYVINAELRYIYQKYSLKDRAECFWEYHKNHIDINIHICGEEIISISNPNEAFQMDKVDLDFYRIDDKEILEEKIHILNKNSPLLVIPHNCPHKCVQKGNSDYVEKITIKIRK